MKYLIIGMCLLLSACHSEIDRPELDAMAQACVERGGIYKIDTALTTMAKCNDGSWVHPTKPKSPPKQ